MENQYIATAFPPHDVSPKEKSDKKKWGVPAAKAIWYSATNSSAPALFWNDRDSYNTYMKYAFGDIDPDQFKPGLHINPKNAGQSFLGGIRWETKKYAITRVQATISRIFNRKYDPVATALDPTSSDRRESFKASLKLWSEQQQWLAEKQQLIGVDLLPDGVDMSMLPENDEDLEVWMGDYKLNSEMLTELGIQYHCKELDFDNIKEKFDQYLTILPVAAVWCGLDANNMPVVKCLNSSRVVAPRSEFNDYKRIPFCGYVDDYTVAEFRQLIGNEYTKEEVARMVSDYSHKGDYYHQNFNSLEYSATDRDVDTIQVMHFEVATNDEYVYLERKDKFGNDRFVEKPYGYYQGKEEDFRKKYRTERNIYRVPKKTVYGGYYIVGSDIVFGYGEKNHLKGELGYKLRASNLLNGRSSCLMKQMIPSLNLIEQYGFKIQQLVASSLPRVIKIDLFALRKASFSLKGKDMGVADLLEIFMQSGILITDTTDLGVNGDARKGIEVFSAGVSEDIMKYLALMQAELEVLDAQIGYNKVSAGAAVSPETGKGVAQQQADVTDINLDHLYRADRSLVLDVYRALGFLHRVSVQANPEYYIPRLGAEAVAKIITSVSFDEIGIDIEARPTAAEWQDLYTDINDMVKALMIEPEDKIALKRFTNLKQASQYLRVVTRKRKREKQNEQQMIIQENAKAQQQSNAQTATAADALEDKRAQNEFALIDRQDALERKKHFWKLEEIDRQNQGSLQETVVEGEYGIAQVKARPAPAKR